MAVIFALITLFGWGTGDVFVALNSRKWGNMTAFFWWLVLTSVLFALYIPFAGGIIDTTAFVFSLGLSAFYTLGNLSYYRALEGGKASIGGAVAGSFPLITVVLSMILFGETISAFQWLGILSALSGVVTVSLKTDKVSKLNLSADKSLKYAFITFIVWGIYFALVRIPISKIGWFWARYPANFFFIFMVLSGKINKKSLTVFENPKSVFLLIMMVLLIGVADFSYNIALSYGFTSVVAPIAGAYPVIFVIMARAIFKEKLERRQIAGVVLSLLGIILLGFTH